MKAKLAKANVAHAFAQQGTVGWEEVVMAAIKNAALCADELQHVELAAMRDGWLVRLEDARKDEKCRQNRFREIREMDVEKQQRLQLVAGLRANIYTSLQMHGAQSINLLRSTLEAVRDIKPWEEGGAGDLTSDITSWQMMLAAREQLEAARTEGANRANNAATTIQAAARRFLAQRLVQGKRRDHAASTIQRAFRRHCTWVVAKRALAEAVAENACVAAEMATQVAAARARVKELVVSSGTNKEAKESDRVLSRRNSLDELRAAIKDARDLGAAELQTDVEDWSAVLEQRARDQREGTIIKVCAACDALIEELAAASPDQEETVIGRVLSRVKDAAALQMEELTPHLEKLQRSVITRVGAACDALIGELAAASPEKEEVVIGRVLSRVKYVAALQMEELIPHLETLQRSVREHPQTRLRSKVYQVLDEAETDAAACERLKLLVASADTIFADEVFAKEVSKWHAALAARTRAVAIDLASSHVNSVIQKGRRAITTKGNDTLFLQEAIAQASEVATQDVFVAMDELQAWNIIVALWRHTTSCKQVNEDATQLLDESQPSHVADSLERLEAQLATARGILTTFNGPILSAAAAMSHLLGITGLTDAASQFVYATPDTSFFEQPTTAQRGSCLAFHCQESDAEFKTLETGIIPAVAERMQNLRTRASKLSANAAAQTQTSPKSSFANFIKQHDTTLDSITRRNKARDDASQAPAFGASNTEGTDIGSNVVANEDDTTAQRGSCLAFHCQESDAEFKTLETGIIPAVAERMQNLRTRASKLSANAAAQTQTSPKSSFANFIKQHDTTLDSITRRNKARDDASQAPAFGASNTEGTDIGSNVVANEDEYGEYISKAEGSGKQTRKRMSSVSSFSSFSSMDDATPEWSHTSVNRQNAEAMLGLAGIQAGTFLLRQSETQAETFTLSLRDEVTLRTV